MGITETVALIPARSGSRRIRNKNLVEIGGKPAVVRAIELAKSCDIFTKILVSTDSEEIEKVAIKHGAESLGLRKSEFAGDFSTTIEVVKYEIERLENQQTAVANLCCLYPVTPLLSKERIIQGFDILATINEGFVFPVQKSSRVESRSLKVNKEVGSIIEDIHTTFRTQDVQEAYFDAGQFYWGSRSSWVERRTIFSSKSKVILFGKWETIDVDEPEDLELVKILFNYRKSEG